MFLKITKPIENFLNGITMYRLMLYFLIFLWITVIVLTFLNLLPFDLWEFLFSSVVILLSCYLTNKFFSRLFKIPTNLESVYITALILVFLILPAKEAGEFVFLTIAGVLAMASKYILALHKKHIFNPAAIAVFITSLISLGYASWWVGNVWTLPVILIGGFLIIKKIKRFSMVFMFLIAFFAATLYFSFVSQSDLVKTAGRIILDSPILFFSFVMLVEPLTSPTTKKMQIIYGVLVGLLAGSQFSIGPIYSTYETALIIGNIFAFFVGFKRRLILTLKEKSQIANGIYEFVFSADHKFVFTSGQYLEWTLSHKNPDHRGVRRYFTIASSPTEENILLGIKIDVTSSSTFKKSLLRLTPGSKIYAGQLSGDFVLPKDRSKKLVFIAGGIGITPFRSIIKNLVDKKENRDIVLFYASSDPLEFVFKDVFEKGSELGLKTVYVCSHPPSDWKGKVGRIDGKLVKEEVSDYKSRIYFLSGPNSMVESYKKMLFDLKIPRSNIVTDYFPGY